MRKKPADVRQLAALTVLHVRSGHGTSRKALAELMALSPSTSGLYVDQMIAAGFLRESGLEQGPMGRPKRRLEARPEAGWFAGVEFNAERAQAVRLDFAGAVAGTVERRLAPNMLTRDVVREIRLAVEQLAGQGKGALLGLGVGVPGVVDSTAGVARQYDFIRDWKNVPLAALLHESHGTPVILENNLRCIALAERWFGGGRDLQDYVILGPRSGFGVAIMQGKKLLSGASHAAGEIGNWPWPLPRGGGQLHDALSSPAVWRRLARAPAGAREPADLRVALAAFAGERNARLDSVRDDFASVIGCLHLLLDSEAYFLHGPLCELGQPFWDEVSARAAGLMSGLLAARPPRIACSDLRDDAGALGAASLAMESWLPA